MKAKTLICVVMTGLYISSYAQQQSLVLTFTASNIGQHVPINSILIENLTQGGDTTLFAPDTLLILDYVLGQDEINVSGEKDIELSQNFPNPMGNLTRVNVYLPDSKTISLTINNLTGKTLLSKSYQLIRGYHTFTIQAGPEGVYFLTLEAARQRKTIKMFQVPANGQTFGAVGIEYAGLSESGQFNHKSIRMQGNFMFNLGDELKFTASSDLGDLSITAIPEENQNFTFEYYVTGIPCPDMPTVTDIDGNVYPTVLIGEQCWMKENLKTTTYNNGSPIPNVTDDWWALATGAYAWYDNDESWKDLYGGLYNWFAATDINGLCPTGWHVPSHDEWTVLTDYIGGIEAPHGNELRSCKQLNAPLPGGCNTAEHPRWDNHNTNYGTDDYGFALLPSGYRGGTFIGLGGNIHLWSSTGFSNNQAWGRNLYLGNGAMGVYGGNRKNGFAIRCIRD